MSTAILGVRMRDPNKMEIPRSVSGTWGFWLGTCNIVLKKYRDADVWFVLNMDLGLSPINTPWIFQLKELLVSHSPLLLLINDLGCQTSHNLFYRKSHHDNNGDNFGLKFNTVLDFDHGNNASGSRGRWKWRWRWRWKTTKRKPGRRWWGRWCRDNQDMELPPPPLRTTSLAPQQDEAWAGWTDFSSPDKRRTGIPGTFFKRFRRPTVCLHFWPGD